jgi:AcrR family transcriptional regulator
LERIYECTHVMKKNAKQTDSASPPKKSRSGKRRENKERTKQAILKAAADLFSTKGFFQTTTKEISTRARIAEGTLFNYFPTKEDLALYFFEQELDGLIQWYGEQTELKEAPLAEQVFAIVNHHLERISPYEDFIGAVYLRALQPASKLNPLSLEKRELTLHYLRFIHDILVEAERRKEIPKVGQVGAYVVGLFHVAMITYWLNDCSRGKENTLALLDRCLKVANTVLLKRGGWEW